MYNKTRSFNLTLNALGLTKRISSADSDESTEAANLRDTWDIAVESFLEEVNISECNEIITLTLVAGGGDDDPPNDHWDYAYAYPNGAALVRRVISDFRIDNNETRIEFIKGIHNGEAVIFTDRADAEAEVAKDTNIFIGLSANSALALAYKHACISSALIQTSQDPSKLEAALFAKYDRFKALAQNKGNTESHVYQDDMVFPTHSYVRTS